MKRLILAALMVLASTMAWAGECETITVADTAIGFTTATYQVPTGYAYVEAYCCNETAQIRVKYDSADSPTSSYGILVNAGDCFRVNNNVDMPLFKAIRVSSTSATLNCCYSFRR